MTILNRTSPINVETITHLYLYGTVDTPDLIEERLRPDTVTSVTGTINTSSYMASSGAGRYASPFQAKIVSDFFGNKLDLSEFSDATGNISVTLAQLKSANIATDESASWSISNYSTDVGSFDYEVRAYVFGTASFNISESAQFIVDQNGSRIIGATPIPVDDNFDFVSNDGIAGLVNNIYFMTLSIHTELVDQ